LYHEDRTHLGLGKDTPGGRIPATAPSSGRKVVSWPRLGGLHHRYKSRLDTPVRTWCVCCRDGSATDAWILAIHIARMIPNDSDTSKTTPCNAVRIGWLPIPFTVETTSPPNFASRSKIRKCCGCSSHSHAWCNCNPTQSALGLRDHIVVNDATAIMAKHEEAIQNAEGQRGHGEKIHRCDRLPMISQGGQPALCRVGRSWRPSHPA